MFVFFPALSPGGHVWGWGTCWQVGLHGHNYLTVSLEQVGFLESGLLMLADSEATNQAQPVEDGGKNAVTLLHFGRFAKKPENLVNWGMVSPLCRRLL